VIKPKSPGQDRFMPLIKADDWETVSFPTPFIDGSDRVQKLLGTTVFRWYCRYLHFQRMAELSRLAARFRHVDKLFLGHEFADEKPFMRHIANTIEYNEAYLLDDGTDTIEIIKRRHRGESKVGGTPIKGTVSQVPVVKNIEMHLRSKYWNWYLDEIPSITFFTIYDLEVRKGDRLIRNDYRYLRSLAPFQPIRMPDTVIFLGQCIADGYFEMDTHFEFLSKVGEYFAGKKLVYVAHPRESADCMDRVRKELKWEVWPSSSVIEHDMLVRGIKPNTVAGFVSSALITLAYLLDSDVDIVCFHIAPMHWIGWREDAIGVYKYLEARAKNRVTVVPLEVHASDSKTPVRSV
jgi:hypothetical protein